MGLQILLFRATLDDLRVCLLQAACVQSMHAGGIEANGQSLHTTYSA